ncbi:conserved hypothetical protein [Trichinella spiralis]|uniref:hypothetical protein n=1 Tax=Trichinella spiralis TaxID=6334 RepID=UPI0001EFB4A5|nr:conserved hypothetical protein [Trichinella spiralis]
MLSSYYCCEQGNVVNMGVRVIDDDGHFDYATSIRLSYNLKEWPASIDQDSSAWKWELQHYISNEYSSAEIEAVIWHGGSINEGLKENVDIVLPNFGFSYLVLTIFCSLTNVMLKADNGVYKIDWIKSKPSGGGDLVGIFAARRLGVRADQFGHAYSGGM